jgi:uncharacterized protein YbjQ (UPF0145 family)
LIENYNPETILFNIKVMEEQGFGDKKRWNKIRKRVEKQQPLDDGDFQYYQAQGDEYSHALEKKREWRIEQIEKLQAEGIGDNKHWETLKQKLREGKNLEGVDLEYFYSKMREFEQGVITTTHDVEGREVIAYLGIVSGQAAIGLMFLKDAIIGLTDVFGGRSGIMERNFETAKDLAIKQMSEKARAMGANAVIGVNINFSTVEGKNKQMLMVISTGTAVITRAKPKELH